MPKKGECVKFKNYNRTIKPLKNMLQKNMQVLKVLAPEDNGNKNPEVLYKPISKTYCFQLML